MKLHRVEIKNFRNFRHLDVLVGPHAVIVGENKVGKSNLLFALRLILDPTLPDAERSLRTEDFWDGVARPLCVNDEVRVAVEFAEFEDNDDHLALLGEYLVQTEPMIARVTYLFRPIPGLGGGPKKDSDYEFLVFGGDRPECRVGFEFRRRLPLNLLPALRDAVGDLANWRTSPLRPLLDRVAGEIKRDRLEELADAVSSATAAIAACDEVESVGERISERLVEMVGSLHAVETCLGFAPADGEKLIRTLRLFIDEGQRSVADASLGTANLLYLALKSLQLDQQVADGERDHTFLAIEEPEAHLHPHVQRRVYRTFLRPRQATTTLPDSTVTERTVLLTTHSPHIVSVAPVRSLVLLRQSADRTATEGVSTAALELSDTEADDIERYLDVTRGELVFARGVLLVEGEAEQYLVPVLAELHGNHLDELGISVCAVGGTHFLPYLKLVGPHGLNMPFAVITDADPDVRTPGVGRVRSFLEYLAPNEVSETDSDEDVVSLGEAHGLFLTDDTFEVALFRAGRHRTFERTMRELSSSGAAKKRAREWKDDPSSLDQDRMLRDIDAIGKGRFAQRWARHISQSNRRLAPRSVIEALNHVIARIRRQPVPGGGEGTGD